MCWFVYAVAALTIAVTPLLRLYKLLEIRHYERPTAELFSRRGQAQELHTFVDKSSVCLSVIFPTPSAWAFRKPSLLGGDEVGHEV